MKKMITSEQVTSEQIDGLADTIASAVRKSIRREISASAETGSLRSADMQTVFASGNKIAAAVTRAVKSILASVISGVVGCLKRISTGKKVVIVATKGTETLATADDVFNWIENWGCDQVEQPTSETSVEVYEQIENADYRTLFGAFGQNLERLCLTTPQIKMFVRDHVDDYLREDGWAWFRFLFKMKDKKTGKNEFFVASVNRHVGGYRDVCVGPFDYVCVWSAVDRGRVVVPQL